MGWFARMVGWFRPGATAAAPKLLGPPSVEVASRDYGRAPPMRFAWQDGEKFPGGFGVTELFVTDYWTLRARSNQLFRDNIYARGIVARLVTNEINTGLHLEATPEEALLGMPEDSLAEWSEDIENRFRLWGKDPRLCDHLELHRFGKLQALARMEALISGDVLCVLLQDKVTGLPRVNLIDASCVQTPLTSQALARGREIRHGVELDADGRHVAYWIRKKAPGDHFEPEKFERLPAFGPRTGRRVAWLLYGLPKRRDDVRGEPLLSIVLQSLKEIDRYRDSVQRKAVINAMLAMFIKKTEDKMGTLPMTGGAVRHTTGTVPGDSQQTDRTFNVAEYIPGLILDELQTGEEPHGFQSNGTDEKFGDFEEAIVQAVAWCYEIPPEILRLSFSSNYSASQAAINEFKLYLNRVRQDFGEEFCQPIYVDWLISQALLDAVPAAGFLEAWRDPAQWVTFGAWSSSDWSGQIKLAVDFSKLVKAYAAAVAEGFITRARAARELTGTKFSKNAQQLTRENLALAEANESLQPEPAEPPAPEPVEDGDDANPDQINDDDDTAQGRAA